MSPVYFPPPAASEPSCRPRAGQKVAPRFGRQGRPASAGFRFCPSVSVSEPAQVGEICFRARKPVSIREPVRPSARHGPANTGRVSDPGPCAPTPYHTFALHADIAYTFPYYILSYYTYIASFQGRWTWARFCSRTLILYCYITLYYTILYYTITLSRARWAWARLPARDTYYIAFIIITLHFIIINTHYKYCNILFCI